MGEHMCRILILKAVLELIVIIKLGVFEARDCIYCLWQVVRSVSLESIEHCRPVRKDNLIHTIPSFASKQYMIFTQCYSIQYIFTTSSFICRP